MRIKACKAFELSAGQAFKVDSVSPPIAVIRGESGAIYAVDDTCTHAEASLSEGFVEDDKVECPLHMSFFCLKTGEACNPPAYEPIKTHAVILEGDDIYVDVQR